MKVLVFGAAGFIASYLIDDMYKKGYEIVACDLMSNGGDFFIEKRIKYIAINISESKDFLKLKNEYFDVVINLASTQPANVSSKNYDPISYFNVNVNGTINILEYCLKSKSGKFILATSHRNTQGMWHRKTLINELDGREIKYSGEYSLFSISETACQDVVTYYSEEFGLKSIMLRIPPVYGYGPHTEIFSNGKPIKTGFQTFIDNAKECKPLEIWGNSNKGRDIIYVKDLINAFILSIESNSANGLYNISSGYKLTLQEEAEVIADLFWGNDEAPEFKYLPEKDNKIEEFVYDISKAKEQLGWVPKYSFRDMLIDIANEGKDKRFSFLIRKRKKMFLDYNN